MAMSAAGSPLPLEIVRQMPSWVEKLDRKTDMIEDVCGGHRGASEARGEIGQCARAKHPKNLRPNHRRFSSNG